MAMKRICAAWLLCGLASTAQAQDARFAGSWRIESVALAPWAEPADAYPEEAKRLVGGAVSFGAKAVSGPRPLGCAGPRYRVREKDGPDMLFQGALAEPDAAGKPRDAAALARRLGMTSPTVATLEVGCSEIEYHALAPDALVFGLNNQIYTLKRAR